MKWFELCSHHGKCSGNRFIWGLRDLVYRSFRPTFTRFCSQLGQRLLVEIRPFVRHLQIASLMVPYYHPGLEGVSSSSVFFEEEQMA